MVLVVTRESADLGLTEITESLNSTPPLPPHTSPRSLIFFNNERPKKKWSIYIIASIQQLHILFLVNISRLFRHIRQSNIQQLQIKQNGLSNEMLIDSITDN